MSVGAAPRLTPDDLLAMPDGQSYELVDGELVELEMSQESSWVAGRIYRRLSEFGEDHGAGWAFPEGTGFVCFRDDPSRVSKPDASFVLRSRQPGGPVTRGFGRIRPDLVVEVVSPNDLAWEVQAKVDDWLEAGVPVVWEVLPATRTVFVHRPGRDVQKISGTQELTLPEFIPDLHVSVADFFPPVATP